MLPDWYNTYKQLIEESIQSYLQEYFWSEKNKWLESMKHACFYAVKWWKRIRSILAIEFYLLFTWKKIEDLNKNNHIIQYCIALELLHAYSLVHDDLPAIDNDTLRRWELTTWKKFGESNAILVWDLFNTLCFEILSQIWNVELLQEFWKAVWFHGMVWWQILDIYYENNAQKLTIDDLTEIHNKKTGALIQASIVWWIILSKVKNNTLKKYKEFWQKIGLAFQIKDDILDVEWSQEETGKSVWGEQKGFVHFIWIEKSKQELQSLLEDCTNIVKDLQSDKLIFLVNYIGNRVK